MPCPLFLPSIVPEQSTLLFSRINVGNMMRGAPLIPIRGVKEYHTHEPFDCSQYALFFMHPLHTQVKTEEEEEEEKRMNERNIIHHPTTLQAVLTRLVPHGVAFDSWRAHGTTPMAGKGLTRVVTWLSICQNLGGSDSPSALTTNPPAPGRRQIRHRFHVKQNGPGLILRCGLAVAGAPVR